MMEGGPGIQTGVLALSLTEEETLVKSLPFMNIGLFISKKTGLGLSITSNVLLMTMPFT